MLLGALYAQAKMALVKTQAARINTVEAIKSNGPKANKLKKLKPNAAASSSNRQ
jgi:hypothetical protein